MNPDRYAVIFDNSKYDNNNSIIDSSMDSTAPAIASSLCTSASTTKPQNQNHYYNEYHEGLLEVANAFLKMLSGRW